MGRKGCPSTPVFAWAQARHLQRLEKLLEDALIKVTTVASRIDTMSVRDAIEALIAGQRDPGKLADLARGRMKASALP